MDFNIESNNLFKCKICKRNYKSQQILDNHCRSFHKMKIKDLNESLQSEDDTMDVNDGERLKCSMCPGRSWKNQASLDAHCRKDHNIYKRPVNLNEEDEEPSENLKCPFECPYTNVYKTMNSLGHHCRKVHDATMDKVKIALNKKIVNKSMNPDYIQSQTSKTFNFQCPVCKRFYKNQDTVDSHC